MQDQEVTRQTPEGQTPEGQGTELTQGGIPHRLYDGYDGGREVPQAFIDKLLAGAPEHIKARMAQVEKERAAAPAQATTTAPATAEKAEKPE